MSLSRAVYEPQGTMQGVLRQQMRPHSPAIRVGDYLFLSGMVPVDPITGERTLGSITRQTHQVLSNMRGLLESNGFSLDNVVRLNITLANLLEADDMWRVFRTFFPDDPPAATHFGMQLSFGNGVEIECIAYLGK
jgi:2-iminobutanoate/2-iminopropanoate deaminase